MDVTSQAVDNADSVLGSPAYYVPTSGRWYLDLNTWRGYNLAYGDSQHQKSQALGVGGIPLLSVAASSGLIIPENGTLLQATFSIRFNSNEAAATGNFSIDILSGGSQATVDQFVLPLSTTKTQVVRTFNQPVSQGDLLNLSARKETGNANRRYGYVVGSFKLSA